MRSMNPKVRNAYNEAADLVGNALLTHVLEPSPPAVNDGEWFADDPVAPRGAPALVPTGIQRPGTTSWSSWLGDRTMAWWGSFASRCTGVTR